MSDTHETQDTIEAWRLATFGPGEGSNARFAVRALQEMGELLAKLTWQDDYSGAAEEIADVVILLCGLATRLGVDLHAEVDAKMAVLRTRCWEPDGTGHFHHVEEATE